jgi:hypothetical protein
MAAKYCFLRAWNNAHSNRLCLACLTEDRQAQKPINWLERPRPAITASRQRDLGLLPAAAGVPLSLDHKQITYSYGNASMPL